MIFITINTTGNEEHYYSSYKAVTYLEVIWVHCYCGLCDPKKNLQYDVCKTIRIVDMHRYKVYILTFFVSGTCL